MDVTFTIGLKDGSLVTNLFLHDTPVSIQVPMRLIVLRIYRTSLTDEISTGIVCPMRVIVVISPTAATSSVRGGGLPWPCSDGFCIRLIGMSISPFVALAAKVEIDF